MLLAGQNGALVLVYRDDATMKLERTPENQPLPGAKLDVWCVRSADGGATWMGKQRLLDGFCGAFIGGICMRSGRLVLPLQDLRYNPPRHVTIVFVSDDGGATWQRSADLDIGGNGAEDGGFESTVAERADGSLLLFLRTTRDRFWRSESRDGGLTWTLPGPTDVPASNSPGYLLQLASGQLALVYNQLYPAGKTDWPRRVKPRYAERPDNVFREELSLALSQDGGATWSPPVVIARQPGGKLRYAAMLERRPGEVWVYLRGQFLRWHERDFAAGKR